jgi:preprotein translocase subunit SecA
MLEMTAAASVDGQKFDGVDLFLFHSHVDPEASEADIQRMADKIAAKGLAREEASGANLSYTSPSEDGQVEIKDQRGRVEQAATARAQNVVVNGQQITSEQARAAVAAAGQGGRGAFGQATGGTPPAANRADRRKK